MELLRADGAPWLHVNDLVMKNREVSNVLCTFTPASGNNNSLKNFSNADSLTDDRHTGTYKNTPFNNTNNTWDL